MREEFLYGMCKVEFPGGIAKPWGDGTWGHLGSVVALAVVGNGWTQ